MANPSSRDIHKFQSALLCVDEVLREHENDPRLIVAAEILRSYSTSFYSVLSAGLAAVIGVDPEEVSRLVTTTNWRDRLQTVVTCSKLTWKEYALAHSANSRTDLTPEELVRVRNLIEKVECRRRRFGDQLELIDDNVPF